MENALFIGTLAAALALLFAWAFKNLPEEKWQIIGSVPRQKTPDGLWEGVNFTFYGLFNAGAVTFSTILVSILLGSVGIPVTSILVFCSLILIACLVASKWLARIVEKKAATFTVGGASFVGILFCPWLIRPFGDIFAIDGIMEPLAVLAAISIAYTFGEGIGRLACISFGCCYGKPLEEVHPILRRIFRHRCFVFTGKTKKIAYAQGLDGRNIFPIQAVTSVILTSSGLVGLSLYCWGHYRAAFLETFVTAQIWRFASEFFRADYRGQGRISAYQWMSLVAAVYAAGIAFLFPAAGNLPTVDLFEGCRMLWNPALLVFFQLLMIAVFLYMGRSRVTAARLAFHVVRDKV